ncbi:hypothetical protein PGTUg99_016101 [Puccinia graminis f. sp. tritici]|uniref:Uncharacterized protein n=1 Tax=Puccinia graminis f. sp. tritici TaxID=56615 RepID=A0A5B0SLK6_PUCGR|nr:hypothetical protein PGTUg99_016101 [Puccinia graminis f. sp. tritici]
MWQFWKGSERFHQERRNSDYGNYCDETNGYNHLGGFNKQPRDFYQNEDYTQGRQDYPTHRGGYNQHGGYGKEKPGYGRGGSSKVSGRHENPKGKEKDNL